MSTKLHTQIKTTSTAAPSFMPVRTGQLQRTCTCGGVPGIDGECPECRRKRLSLQRRATNTTEPSTVPPIVQDVLHSPGQPLDAGTRDFMEPRFGHDFSRIPTYTSTAGAIQTKLAINKPGDEFEQEADRIADQVLAAPAHPAGSGVTPHIQHFVRQPTGQTDTVPTSVDHALTSSSRPLEPTLRQDMEQRFGYDFSRVRVHSNDAAERSARDVNAQAYTVGHNIVFGAGRFVPGTCERRRLIAHELTHVVQQSGSEGTRVGQSDEEHSLVPLGLSANVVQRQSLETNQEDLDIAAEREYAKGGPPPKAKTCGRPPWCPAGFCDPYPTEALAIYHRSKDEPFLIAGIALAVNSRVVPLWKEYLWGGSPKKNLTADFGKDFTNSPTTKKTTTFLYDELKKSLAAKPPFSTTSIDIPTQIPMAIAALDDPASPNQMNFSIPKDIPGNLAGGMGKDQITCKAGAQPSPFNDQRLANGTASVVRTSGSNLTVTPSINYVVKDTIDLCPGDCGRGPEWIATVPLSQFEATGISGDVPFEVDFPAPPLVSFSISAPLPPAP